MRGRRYPVQKDYKHLAVTVYPVSDYEIPGWTAELRYRSGLRPLAQ